MAHWHAARSGAVVCLHSNRLRCPHQELLEMEVLSTRLLAENAANGFHRCNPTAASGSLLMFSRFHVVANE